MWKKQISDQMPVILVTAGLIVVAALFIHFRTVSAMEKSQQAELSAQRAEFDAQLKASAEDTRRQIDAVNKLLKDAIQKRSADVFMTDEELAKANADKVEKLAEAIANRMQPNMPLPKTPEEAEKLQNEQIDKVSGRLAEKINPILSEMSKDQNLTREEITKYSQRISDQVGTVLTAELAKNQQLNNNLIASQALARESLALSHEATALYLSTFKDQGVLTRLLLLPANVVRDASKLSLVSGSDRKKIEEQLVTKMTRIENDLNTIQSQQPHATVSANSAAPATTLATTPTKPAAEPKAADAKTEAKPAAKPEAKAKNGK
ncbi:MAG TPA: hypothetical protein PK879_07190 [Opitutaceae bacterium]|mgnify:FL=1|nr:MAG: hypothetical protein BWX86_00621 [Verrucomicrobia bacterium ADurb.Bin122]HPO00478.1 hypothetical protein [Opitutaceae bacterium]